MEYSITQNAKGEYIVNAYSLYEIMEGVVAMTKEHPDYALDPNGCYSYGYQFEVIFVPCKTAEIIKEEKAEALKATKVKEKTPEQLMEEDVLKFREALKEHSTLGGLKTFAFKAGWDIGEAKTRKEIVEAIVTDFLNKKYPERVKTTKLVE